MRKFFIASCIVLNSITTPVNSFSFKTTSKNKISKKITSTIDKALNTSTIANNYLKEHFNLITNNLPIYFPVKIEGFSFISSFYGVREHPVLNLTRIHKGIDLAGIAGTPIYATANGVIKKVKYEHGYGRHIIINHGNDIISIYGHLSKSFVKKGDTVKVGQQIGLLGNTGISTGPHLHYEIRIKNKSIDLLKLLNCSRSELLNKMLNFQNYKQWEKTQAFQIKL